MGLLTAGLGFAATSIEPNALASTQERVQHVFFAAGVRFQPSVSVVTNGEVVRLRRENVGGTFAYAILVPNGARIGYVPKGIAKGLGDAEAWDGCLQAVDQDGVPWKRYKIKLISRLVFPALRVNTLRPWPAAFTAAPICGQ
jgi:hypothetical protein